MKKNLFKYKYRYSQVLCRTVTNTFRIEPNSVQTYNNYRWNIIKQSTGNAFSFNAGFYPTFLYKKYIGPWNDQNKFYDEGSVF